MSSEKKTPWQAKALVITLGLVATGILISPQEVQIMAASIICFVPIAIGALGIGSVIEGKWAHRKPRVKKEKKIFKISDSNKVPEEVQEVPEKYNKYRWPNRDDSSVFYDFTEEQKKQLDKLRGED